MTNLFFRFSPILIFTISGRSMDPTLKHGEKVVVIKKIFGRLKNNDIVILHDPRNTTLLLKRIHKIKENTFFLIGDNKKESTDSRNFGWVKKRYIIGKVIGKM